MSSGSVRLHTTLPLHQHGGVGPGGDGRGAFPDDSRGEDGDFPCAECCAGRLWREGDKVMFQGARDDAPVAVRVVWAKPLSERGGPVSIMLAEKKKEVAYLNSLDAFSGESRKVAEEELAAGMLLPRILRIIRVRPRFGNYYWDVDTDKGKTNFLLTSPENNCIRPAPDAIVIKDVAGNCYEINPISGLDPHSLGEMGKVF